MGLLPIQVPAVTSVPKVPLPSAAGTSGNSAQLLVDEPVAFPIIYNAIRDAKTSVDISMFSLLPDGSGAQLGALLKQKAAEGVEVNLQVDDVGSFQWEDTDRHFIDSLKAAGVNIVRNEHGDPLDTNHVDHRKLYVIDGKTAFLGGMNLGTRYDTWHDTMVKLQGPAVAQASALFLQQWQHDGGAVSATQQGMLSLPQAAAGNAQISLIENRPGTSSDLTQSCLDSINSAKQRVWVSSPYIGDERFAQALKDAAQRGVDVRLFTTGSTAKGLIPGMTMLSRSFYPELLGAGVKIYEEPQMAHAKVLLTDSTASVGSMNLTRTSAEHDYELNMATRDPKFVADAYGMFNTDQQNSKQVTGTELHTTLDRILGFFRQTLHIQH